MFERLISKLVQRLLQNYFENYDDQNLAIWSGFCQLTDLKLNVNALNSQLARQPLQIIHGQIRSLQITVPWSKLSKNVGGEIVIVLDGVYLLASMDYDFRDEALKQTLSKKRRQQIQAATTSQTQTLSNSESNANNNNTWKEYFKGRLLDSILPGLAEKVQVHIRDVHVRVEDLTSDPEHPFAFGIVLESMHIQQESKNTNEKTNLIRTVSHLNHFGAYFNYLVEEYIAEKVEHCIWHDLSVEQVIQALDQTIARRGYGTIPAHSYLLLPFDGTLQATLATRTQQNLYLVPALELCFTIPDVSYLVRDFQCLYAYRWVLCMQNYKFILKYRHLRPTVAVAEQPNLWWQYAVHVISLQLKENRLKWSLGRFRRGLKIRRRYMELYERKICATVHDLDPGQGNGVAKNGLVPLNPEELVELEEMEDGFRGDLSVEDLLLYRIVVHRRNGVPVNGSASQRVNWFRRQVQSVVVDDEEAQQDFDRLLTYWQEWLDQEPVQGDGRRSVVAVTFDLRVKTGNICFFSPLGDSSGVRRLLQQKFLDLVYRHFEVNFKLMNDFDSWAVTCSLAEFDASELRSDGKAFRVVHSGIESFPSEPYVIGSNQSSLFGVLVTKNPSSNSDCAFSIQAYHRVLHVDLIPDCEWILRMKGLVQPLPRFQKASMYWKEMNMARINSWASDGLALLAKVNSAFDDHSSIHLDVNIDCPVVNIADGIGSRLIIDLGSAHLRTERLVGVGDVLNNAFQVAKMVVPSSVQSDDINASDPRSTTSSQRLYSTPPRHRSRKGPLSIRGVAKSQSRRQGGSSDSVTLGGSLVFDEVSRLDGFDDAIAGEHQNENAIADGRTIMDSLFYDVYELELNPGGLFVQTGEESDEIVSATGVHFVIHKSIIPADHTLSKFKIRCTIDDASVSVSVRRALALSNILRTWSAYLSNRAPVSVAAGSRFVMHVVELVDQELVTETTEDSSERASSFDENEYFDAEEGDSDVGDDVATLLDEHWVSDSESAVDSETRSFTDRHRQRLPSISDVSSISEASIGKKRSKLLHGSFYLSAENLARLEEEAVVDDSFNDEESPSDCESFHSAVSPSHLLALEQRLENDIREAESNLETLKSKLSEARRTSDNGSSDGSKERRGIKRALRLEIQRVSVELRALRAALFDLVNQKEAAQNEILQAQISDSKVQTVLLAQRTERLLQCRRQRGSMISAFSSDHNLTQGLKRDLLQLSMNIRHLRLSLYFDAEEAPTDLQGFVVSISHIAVILRQSIGESKLFISVDNMDATLRDNFRVERQRQILLVGGANYSLSGSLLPSRLPQFVSPASMEEKLLRCSFEFKRVLSQSRRDKSLGLSKVRINIGDVEFSPRPASLQTVSAQLARMTSTSKQSGNPSNRCMQNGPMSAYQDIAIRFASLRVALFTSEAVGAIALTEMGFRFAKARSNLVYRDRSQLDVRCNNIQLIGVDDLEAGLGVELFGRRDVFGPVLRARFRQQLVPEHETGGWVTGSAPMGWEENEKLETIWNAHWDITIDGLKGRLVPTNLRRIKDALALLTAARPKCSRKNSDSMKDAIPGPPTARWRVDISCKQSSIDLLCSSGQKENYDGVNDVAPPTFNILFAFTSYLQQCSHEKEGMTLRCSIDDFSLVRSQDRVEVIEQVRILVVLDVPLLGVSRGFRKSSRAPNLWMEKSPLDIAGPTVRRENAASALAILLGVVGVNFSTSTIILIHEVCREFSESWKKTDAANSSQDTPNATDGDGTNLLDSMDTESLLSIGTSETSLGSSGWHNGFPKEQDLNAKANAVDWYCSLQIEGIDVSFSRESIRQERLLALRLCGITLSAHSSAFSSGCALNVINASLVDFSGRSGIVFLSCGFAAEPDVSIQDSSHPCTDFIALAISSKPISSRFHLSLDLLVGQLSVLPLPSAVRIILDIKKDIDGLSDETMKQVNKPKPPNNITSASVLHRSLRRLKSIHFSVRSRSLECILSSRDLVKYVRDSSNDLVNVVKVRAKAECLGSVRITKLDTSASVSLEGLVHSCEDRVAVEEAFTTFLSRRATWPSTSITSDIELSLEKVEILRTQVSRSGESPCSFETTSAETREQRITNSFNIHMKHNLAYACFPSNCREHEMDVSAAHAIKLDADFVDVLLYISQSSGGLHESLRTSIKPIAEMLKAKTDPKRGDAAVLSSQRVKQSSFLTGIPVILSIRAEGVRVTCVPGGASRLTEAPIFKFATMNASGGLAFTHVSTGVKLVSSVGLDGIASASRKNEKHIVAGGWLTCSLSASYHNRRLVAWEPFVEPWGLELCFGADLSRLVTKLQPVVEDDTAFLPAREGNLPPNPASRDITGGRFRDIGRLLRSPFHSDRATDKAQEAELPMLLSHDVDFCYLAVATAARRTISLATFPFYSSGGPLPLSLLPCNRPVVWLNRFGYPSDLGDDPKSTLARPAVELCASDAAPLNINVTGALIENLSGYLTFGEEGALKRLAPHWIRNDSGLTIRFQEILDPDRQARGDDSPKFTLSNDSQIPFSLKRSLSQSCDPHEAHILLELGNFEDTFGRVTQTALDPPKGSRSSSFAFRVSTKIPIDRVGLHSYPLDWNIEKRPETVVGGANSRSPGCVIVRIALIGGVKMVTVESPLMLKNVLDTDLICEVREHDGLSVVWRAIVPKARDGKGGFLSIPADIVSSVQSEGQQVLVAALPAKSTFQHESEVSLDSDIELTEITLPVPYSKSSLSQGVIQSTDEILRVLPICASSVHVNLCCLRIGSFGLENIPSYGMGARADSSVPEQRMMLIRSPLEVFNHTAAPVRVQVKLSQHSEFVEASRRNDDSEWIDLGTIDCGHGLSWGGAASTEKIELRVKYLPGDGYVTKAFPDWSSSTIIPATGNRSFPRTREFSEKRRFLPLPDLKVLDSVGSPLLLSVALTTGMGCRIAPSSFDSIKSFSDSIQGASRVVGLFVPFWIIDNTGLDLQFKSGTFLAPRLYADSQSESPRGRCMNNEISRTLGLGELLDDNDLAYIPSRLPFEVLMIGNEGSKRLHVRRRHTRQRMLNMSMSPWSDPIPLNLEANSKHDTTVLPPSASATFLPVSLSRGLDNGSTDGQEPFALRSRFIRAPTIFGGNYGTMLVHVVCRYSVTNVLGREIEIVGDGARANPTVLEADGRLRPFHVDDSVAICFRPKEFGWMWSGRFHVRHDRSEITVQLKHKLKGEILFVTIEFLTKQKDGTCIIAFRPAVHAPYKIENNTIYPIQYRQLTAIFKINRLRREHSTPSTSVVLPYHQSEFAWDEPEYGRKSIAIELADFGDLPQGMKNRKLGTFQVDRIAPGTTLDIHSPYFVMQVDADGPTRVFRLSTTANHSDQEKEALESNKEGQPLISSAWSFKLSHGIGISFVDWSPQELVYVRFEDIVFERSCDGLKESVSCSVGCVMLDNQLWVTQYPVMLRMGSRLARRRNRRHCAISLSWRRKQKGSLGLNDLTIFESVELSTEPWIINVDGSVIALLIEMMRRILAVGPRRLTNAGSLSRNVHLRQLLDIADHSDAITESQDAKSMMIDDLYSAIDYMATAAIAFKLRSYYRPPIIARPFNTNENPIKTSSQTIARRRHKYYLERLKVSAIAAKVSWYGSPPISSSLLRLVCSAITFEGVPVFIRPFSCDHAYGTAEEHLQALKSHYVSIWRLMDLTVGVLLKPTLLVRASIFTWKKSVSTAFELISGRLLASGTALVRLTSNTQTDEEWLIPNPIFQGIVYPIANLLTKMSDYALTGSKLLEYKVTGQRTSGSLVRSRNPRLFANVDGKDLLVEYVEGENAGKALLSRVRLGCYLGEGYVFHMEGTHIFRSKGYKQETDMDPATCILMLTYDHILLLNGQLNEHFCDVVWEAWFADVVNIEVQDVPDGPTYVMLLVWFLLDMGSASRVERTARAIVSDQTGLDTLRCKQVVVPKVFRDALISSLRSIDDGLFSLRSVR